MLSSESIWLIVTAGYSGWLLDRFISYYQSLGFENILLIAHSLAEGDADHQNILRIAGDLNCRVCASWHGPFSEEKKIAFEQQIKQRYCPRSAWVFYADTDEFQEHQQPISTLIESCSRGGSSYIKGYLVDRVANDGTLAEIVKGKKLEHLFPLAGDISGKLMGACTTKVIAAKAYLNVSLGHHYIAHPKMPLKWVPIDAPGKHIDLVPIHHFKWDSSLQQRWSAIMQSDVEDLRYWREEIARFQRLLAEEGRIDTKNLSLLTASVHLDV